MDDRFFKNFHAMTFLPVLSFICGLRIHNPKFFLEILIVTAILGIALKYIPISKIEFSKKHFQKNSRNLYKYFKYLQEASIICSVLSLTGLSGAIYWHLRGCETIPLHEKNMVRYANIQIKPDIIFVKNKKYGMFYGYGSIWSVNGKNNNFGNGRLFFSVDSSVCNDIPVRGQLFTIAGSLKFVENSKSVWFTKHLHSMKIDCMINNACLLRCDSKASSFQKLCRKALEKFLHALTIGVPDNEIESGLMSGMLTGMKQSIDKFSRSMFSDLGIAHLFAVGGLHIGIIAGAIEFFLRLFCVNRRYRIFPILFLLICYVNIIGCSPSSLRALTMVVCYYIAIFIGRRPNVLSALINSAFLNAIYDPFVVFNVSYLMSYAVVTGIVLIGVPLQNILYDVFCRTKNLYLMAYSPLDRVIFLLKKLLISSFSISVAASFAGMPLSAERFGVISLLTVLVNMIIIPIASWAITMGAMTLFFSICNLSFLCAILNKISCLLIFIVRTLSRSLYFEITCFRNFQLPFASDCFWTALILISAYLFLFNRKVFFRGSEIL